MKRNVIKALVAGLAIVLLATIVLPVGSILAASENNLRMTVMVEGLEGNDEAVLRIGVDDGSLELSGQPILEYTVKAAGGAAREVEINASLEDGHYRLVVDAPDKYFREPRGYAFNVSQSAVLNPGQHSIVFKLIPPEARDYGIYRQPSPTTVPNFSPVVPTPPTGEVKYRMEAVVDLSAPPKLPITVGIPSTEERIYQWWQVPQLRVAAAMILLIVGAAIFGIVRTFSWLRARRGSG